MTACRRPVMVGWWWPVGFWCAHAMRRVVQLILVLAVLVLGAIAVASGSATNWWGLAKPPQFRTAKADRGQIVYTVNSTGTVKPVQSVLIGSFVSGPVSAILVDFNDHVTKGQLLAKIDPRLYEANVFRDQATLRAARERLERAGFATPGEARTECCYAELDQYWATDPSGVRWELFLAHREVIDSPAACSTASGCCPSV